MSKLKKNFMYLSLYKILEMLLPMITSPILSRRLGAEALGTYSYSYSIVNIFLVIAQLGVYNYGMREIAKVRENQKKLNITYTNIFFTHAISGGIVTLVYFFSLFWIQQSVSIIFLIQGLFLISNIVDNAFLFVGLENIKVVSIRDAAIKIITFILIVVLIKEPSDLLLYTIIMVTSSIVCKSIGLIYAKKFVKFVKPSIDECKKHIKPMIILMIPTLASIIYQSMDKIMIGWLHGKKEVGYYECASKALIPRNIITALGTVMCPHIANMYAQGKKKESIGIIEQSLIICLIMSYIFTFGIVSISKEFAPWFWGEEFSVCSNMLSGLALTIPIWCVGEVIRNQLLLPLGKDNEYMIAFVLGIITNAIINFIFIPIYGVMGAIVATLIAEAVMSCIQIYFVRKEIKFIKCVLKTIPYLIIAIIMTIIVRVVANKINTGLTVKIVSEIFIGAIIFFLLTLLYECTTKNKIFLSYIIKRRKEV